MLILGGGTELINPTTGSIDDIADKIINILPKNKCILVYPIPLYSYSETITINSYNDIVIQFEDSDTNSNSVFTNVKIFDDVCNQLKIINNLSNESSKTREILVEMSVINDNGEFVSKYSNIMSRGAEAIINTKSFDLIQILPYQQRI